MVFSTIHIVWTVMLVLIFVGIAFWAWSSSPKERFKDASLLPFDDEPAKKTVDKTADTAHAANSKPEQRK